MRRIIGVRVNTRRHEGQFNDDISRHRHKLNIFTTMFYLRTTGVAKSQIYMG